MQTSYQLDLNPVGYPGQLADTGPADIVTAISLQPGSFAVTITAANSTAFTLTSTRQDGSGTVTTATYTSTASDTVAGIAAGLTAAIAAKQGFDYDAILSNGILTLVPKPNAAQPTATLASTGAGVMTLAATGGNIPFGSFVCFDGASLRARLPAAAGDIGLGTIGLVLSSQFQESEYLPTNPNNAPFVPAGAALNVLRAGRAWVKVEQAVVVGGPVFVRYTANGALTPGSVRTDADTSRAAQITGAKFIDNANAGGYARVQLNIA